MSVDKQPKNLLVNYIGSGQFSFATGATSPAAGQLIGFRDFGNLKTFSVTSKSTNKKHVGSYNGVKREDKTAITEVVVGYQVEADEMGTDNIALFVYGSRGAAYTQTARTAVAADALSTPVVNRWYDLLIAGVRVFRLTAVAITSTPSVVENTDFVIDYDSGRIRWITTPPGTITSILLTAPAISGTAGINTVVPATTPILRGMGRMKVYDSDGTQQFDHPDFYCELTPNGDVSFADDFAAAKIDINIVTQFGTVITFNG
jgi:hypothetical protein